MAIILSFLMDLKLTALDVPWNSKILLTFCWKIIDKKHLSVDFLTNMNFTMFDDPFTWNMPSFGLIIQENMLFWTHLCSVWVFLVRGENHLLWWFQLLLANMHFVIKIGVLLVCLKYEYFFWRYAAVFCPFWWISSSATLNVFRKTIEK